MIAGMLIVTAQTQRLQAAHFIFMATNEIEVTRKGGN